jgi:hypothetical protein
MANRPIDLPASDMEWMQTLLTDLGIMFQRSDAQRIGWSIQN